METLIKSCLEDYFLNLPKFQKMYNYYLGKTDAMLNYQMITNRTNNKVNCNFIKTFIKEEVSYIVGNKVTYISKSGNEDIINAITQNLAHWSEKHDQNLCKKMLTFGEAYELYYVDKDGLFSAQIYSPLNSYALLDDYGNVQMFLVLFKKKFDETQYLDVYYPGKVEHYTVSGISDINYIGEDTHIFDEVPVAICSIAEEKEFDTLFNDLKGLQDAYETNLSDISNEISDFRNAYLMIMGAEISADDLAAMKQLGAMKVPQGGDVRWLTKNINDAFIQNTLKTLEDKMYQISNHINANEKLSSNTSSLALRTRLISLENKCKLNADALADALKTRLKFLFKYLKIKTGQNFDYRDVKIKFTPNIPQDDLMTAQIISQLNGKLSTETALAQLSFVDNPKEEIAKLRKEQEEVMSINLDSIPDGVENG
ncbi:phage portal protein [Thermosediminibacter oceani]|uniref:Phage portal protein, SPP1 family n=1 Tax=Thermosediminibacter oceani (strain ATCC BAA-1034 / DSM 16646 / JW/IW-1228P) TaxID=555079 RepID=D9S3R2_THEOJ|nr:phage portal protein [Thermosediminibacter oceani]ADL08039.1 phage portal protein, SPP1 family [Thermosediminibacter oceani DSM 16646]